MRQRLSFSCVALTVNVTDDCVDPVGGSLQSTTHFGRFTSLAINFVTMNSLRKSNRRSSCDPERLQPKPRLYFSMNKTFRSATRASRAEKVWPCGTGHGFPVGCVLLKSSSVSVCPTTAKRIPSCCPPHALTDRDSWILVFPEAAPLGCAQLII